MNISINTDKTEWIEMPYMRYPFNNSVLKSEHILSFFSSLAQAATIHGKNENYFSFRGTVRAGQQELEGNKFVFLECFSNQREIRSMVMKEAKDLLNMAGSDNEEEKKAFRESYFKKIKSFETEWEIAIKNFPISPKQWTVFEIKVDFIEKLIELHSIENTELAADNFPGQLKEFKEAIILISYFLNHPILSINGMEWFISNNNCAALTAYLIDNKNIDFSKLMINKNNPEEWKYIYPSFSIEAKDYKLKQEEKNVNISIKQKMNIKKVVVKDGGIGNFADKIQQITLSSENQISEEDLRELKNQLAELKEDKIGELEEKVKAVENADNVEEQTRLKDEIKDFLFECGIAVNQNIAASFIFEFLKNVF